MAMARHRRLEWTRCKQGTDLATSIAEAGPAAWEPVCPETLVQDFDEAPGWFAFMLFVRVDGSTLRGDRPERLSDDVWVYMVDLYDSDAEWYYECPIAVREVPSGLIFNCSISILEDKWFEAIFTNLAGKQVLRLLQALPPKLSMGCLIFIIKIYAQRQGLLQSQNQEVRVLLNNSTVELPWNVILCGTTVDAELSIPRC